MADEPIRDPHLGTDYDHARVNRGMLGLVGTFLVIVIVVLMLLMFRGYDATSGQGSGGSGAKEIVPVEGLSANPGFVSAWVAPDADIKSLLKVSGLENSTITSMGGGRYVISVPPGSEDTVVRLLADFDGIYDAGRVYDLGK